MRRRTEQNKKDELNERQQRVLWAVAQDYALTAEPVGSRTIARKYKLGVSSATIRNEMQDLEDEGYLEQPHTSAGRVPSVKGYRFYVDRLMEPVPVTQKEKEIISSLVSNETIKVDELFQQMAKVVASLTHTLSLATSSDNRSVLFNYIRFLPLDAKRAILLAVTDEGDVTNTIVSIPKNSSLEEMQVVADKLNHFLHGRDVRSLDEKTIMEFQKDVERDISGLTSIFVEMERALAPKRKVYSGGVAALIDQPEFQNVERMKDILNLLERRDVIQGMLGEQMEKPLAIHIGTENESKSLSDLSVIRAQFSANGEVVGTIAVMGPKRMQYDRIIGVLYFLQQQLDHMLRDKDK
jgi:heat-inducible transcriptional repressor